MKFALERWSFMKILETVFAIKFIALLTISNSVHSKSCSRGCFCPSGTISSHWDENVPSQILAEKTIFFTTLSSQVLFQSYLAIFLRHVYMELTTPDFDNSFMVASLCGYIIIYMLKKKSKNHNAIFSPIMPNFGVFISSLSK